jgi:hypothetical protein
MIHTLQTYYRHRHTSTTQITVHTRQTSILYINMKTYTRQTHIHDINMTVHTTHQLHKYDGAHHRNRQPSYKYKFCGSQTLEYTTSRGTGQS